MQEPPESRLPQPEEAGRQPQAQNAGQPARPEAPQEPAAELETQAIPAPELAPASAASPAQPAPDESAEAPEPEPTEPAESPAESAPSQEAETGTPFRGPLDEDIEFQIVEPPEEAEEDEFRSIPAGPTEEVRFDEERLAARRGRRRGEERRPASAAPVAAHARPAAAAPVRAKKTPLWVVAVVIVAVVLLLVALFVAALAAWLPRRGTGGAPAMRPITMRIGGPDARDRMSMQFRRRPEANSQWGGSPSCSAIPCGAAQVAPLP